MGNGVRCIEIGYKVPFDWARMEALYGSSKGYAAQVAESPDRLVKERRLTEADARKIRAEVVTATVSSR